MALMELLYKHCELHCPYRENGCRFVFQGKDKEIFIRHKATCRYGKGGFIRDKCSSFGACNIEKEPKQEVTDHKQTREKIGEPTLPANWIESVRHAQIYGEMARLKTENETNGDQHREPCLRRRERYTSMTCTISEEQESRVSYPKRANSPKGKVTEEIRALFRFKSI